MNQQELNAQPRELTGKGAARKLRTTGMIPAIVYGRDTKTLSISLSEKEVSDLLATGKAMRSLITLKIDDRVDLSKKVMMFREIQRHHIYRTPLAADLLIVDPEQKIDVPVPVILKGDAPGVIDGGVLQQLVRSVLIHAKANDLPEEIIVDVSNMGPGDTLYVEDMNIPEGLEVDVMERAPIASITIPRGLDEEEEVDEEEVEGEEGEEGEEVKEGEKKEESSSEKPSS